MTAKVRYQCTYCKGYGHRRNTCPQFDDGGKSGPRYRDATNTRVDVVDDLWLLEQESMRAKIQRECDDILRLEELVGHRKLEEESVAAGLEYHRFGVADVETDEVRAVRATKAAEDAILKMQRGEW